jgi:hypothetical protein
MPDRVVAVIKDRLLVLISPVPLPRVVPLEALTVLSLEIPYRASADSSIAFLISEVQIKNRLALGDRGRPRPRSLRARPTDRLTAGRKALR